SALKLEQASKVTLPVSGMTCAACQSFIEKTLTKQPGVETASVNLMMNNATVTFRPEETSAESLVEAIRQTGYGAELPRPETTVFADQETQDRELRAEYVTVRNKAITSLIAGAIAMVVSMRFMSGEAAPDNAVSKYVLL